MYERYPYPDELYHYGVLGMKWGVRKAVEYKRDLNRSIRNTKTLEARKNYRSGKISKQKYKSLKKQYKLDEVKENYLNKKQIKSDAEKNLHKDTSVKSIYQPYKKEAYNKIANYSIKRAGRNLGRILSAAQLLSGGYAIGAMIKADIPLKAAVSGWGYTTSKITTKIPLSKMSFTTTASGVTGLSAIKKAEILQTAAIGSYQGLKAAGIGAVNSYNYKSTL